MKYLKIIAIIVWGVLTIFLITNNLTLKQNVKVCDKALENMVYNMSDLLDSNAVVNKVVLQTIQIDSLEKELSKKDSLICVLEKHKH